jgi:hypothetical protein
MTAIPFGMETRAVGESWRRRGHQVQLVATSVRVNQRQSNSVTCVTAAVCVNIQRQFCALQRRSWCWKWDRRTPRRPVTLPTPPIRSTASSIYSALYPRISVVSCIPRARVPAPRIHFLVTHPCVRLRLSQYLKATTLESPNRDDPVLGYAPDKLEASCRFLWHSLGEVQPRS